jgi:hypothetical protein
MKLTYFFEATIRKEQIASAFLATLLNEKSSFRRFFFEKAFPAEAVTLSKYDWKVEVEPYMVDIRLSSVNAVVIIENKVRAGAKREAQLIRYYQEQKGREPDQRVLAVYLAPRRIGASEIAGLVPELKGGDSGVHVSWEDMLTFNAKGDSDVDVIENAFELIRDVLNDYAKYPHEGDRGVIAEVVDDVLKRLRQTGARLGRWTGRDFEEIFTYGSPFTIWLDAAFEAETVQPWLPKDVRTLEEKLRLTIRSQFRLSERAGKDPEVRTRWAREFSDSEVGVSDLVYRRDPGSRWFRQQHEMTGTPKELADRMATVGRTLLDFLAERTERPSLPT